VSEYRLSLRTRADPINIYAFTEAKFGRYQADAYHAGFERTFDLLAEFPGIGPMPTNSWPVAAAFGFNRTTSSTLRKPTMC
jgi:plasmid stabilization system protein ParE